MAEAPKRGLRARLGLSSNKSSGPRQRLTKKTSLPNGDANNRRKDSSDTVDSAVDRRHTVPTEYDRWTTPRTYSVDAAQNQPQSTWTADGYPLIPERISKLQKPLPKAAHQYHKDVIDKDTGERKDLTEMMHALRYDESLDDIPEYMTQEDNVVDYSRARGEPMFVKLSAELWVQITDYLQPREAANLALTCKTILWLLGSRPFDNLLLLENRQQRIKFLLPMDVKVPNQLFCFPCAAFHNRLNPGFESLKPTGVLNPLFNCPNKTNNLLPPPRHRITPGRALPFTFVQLVTRAHRFGAPYGIPPDSLSRRWRDPWSDWTHQTRYHVHKNGHLLMRVVSQVFADGGLTIAAKRMLLYSRDDYTPYFSVCAHWKDGVMMDNCKCALDHIPVAKHRTAYLGGAKMPPPGIASLCGKCQPMRRCPRCPSEYLIELKLVEDKTVAMGDALRFKQALVVTRWCDLGSGIDPHQREWAAIQGESDEYDSFEEIGNRSVSSIFESAFTDHFPYQRLISLNPKNEHSSENGGKWY
ncbi:hypothetical protein K461DRAFT_275548 [Myriangium duriaei CBS 260.36]|uniref:F-box domain-containing protein n=1 Tax=Myriangium duriaei CBS 260.36 TaxID=1168546 RepID=A0A9P4J7E0_9PEZI|nr:hypothetical protein K461DRAFT_275548 [Myriangium duriaei CBS 260.36]